MSASLDTSRTPQQDVEYVLDIIHKRQRNLESCNWVAAEVGQFLKYRLQDTPLYLREADWQLVGSAAEHLAIWDGDDKDLIFTLGRPYTPEFFTAIHEGSGHYKMKWNKRLWNGHQPPHLNTKNTLVVNSLRTEAYDYINAALKNAFISRMKVTKVMLWKQTVRVLLRDPVTSKKHIVDVILQLKGDKWKKTQGVLSWENLHSEMQNVIASLETLGQPAIYYSLHGPPGTSSTTVTTNYSVIEREFFLMNDKLRDAVLLAKVIFMGHNWKNKYGLKTAHVKRLAMKHFMVVRHCSPWHGMQLLLQVLVDQLREGSIEGYPDSETDLFWHKTEEDCQHIAKSVQDVMLTLMPNFLVNYL